jgi:hypothetical protein
MDSEKFNQEEFATLCKQIVALAPKCDGIEIQYYENSMVIKKGFNRLHFYQDHDNYDNATYNVTAIINNQVKRRVSSAANEGKFTRLINRAKDVFAEFVDN